jgi:radical SAM superfamily enzyme YgiQ (UPF0313 family)
MRILLISPASGNWHHLAKRKLFNGKTFRFSMLSLLTVAKLSPDDAAVRLVDEQVEETPLEESFDLVGITCMTATAPRAFELCRLYKQKGATVVLGGFFPSLNPQAALRHADAVVTGPAFDAWPRLCEDFRRGVLQKVYVGNPDGTVPATLPREMIQADNYSTPNATYATMGCRNKCKFCSISAVYQARHITRPMDEVAAEIQSFGSKFFMFIDDNLTQNREYALALFERLAPMKKHWITQASIEIAEDEELLSAMANAGCVGLFIGLETFNANTLNDNQKQFNAPAHYKKAVSAIHRHGIFVEAGIIFGFDQDTAGVFESTLRMLEKTRIDAIQTSILTPLPGTALHTEMQSRIIDSDYEHYDYRHVVFEPRRMTAEQLQDGADWVIRRYYSPWRIVLRTVRWLISPRGWAHCIYPLVLNWAYFGRTIAFGIRVEIRQRRRTQLDQN